MRRLSQRVRPLLVAAAFVIAPSSAGAAAVAVSGATASDPASSSAAVTAAAAAEATPANRVAPIAQFEGIYKLDVLHARPDAFTSAVGLLDLKWSVDAERLFGWDGTSLRLELLWTHGAKPNRRLSTLQGVSNLEVAENSAKLYAASIERRFSTQTSVLVGLYDLNSEFYATEASALLIHPAFGIGSELAQTGRSGPSIFPSLALGARLRTGSAGGAYAQAVVLDGIAGDPAHSGRTSVRLQAADGALVVAESGWREPRSGDGAPNRWGVGAWTYTRSTPRLDASGSSRNAGVYGLAQRVLLDGAQGRTVGFVRAGIAAARVNAIERALDAGVAIARPWGERGPAALTAGIALARLSGAQRERSAAEGEATGPREMTVEVGARWQPTQQLAVQPLVQHVRHVAGRPGRDATLVGVRVEWALAARPQ